MTKKLGPLPVWAWGLILGVGAYFLYERYRASATAGASAPGTTGIMDPNAVDPNTGLTYGQEEAAALNASAAQLAGSGPSATPSDSGAQSTVPSTNEFGDFLTFLGELDQFQQAAAGVLQPVAQSPTSQAAQSSPAVQTATSPTTQASAHVGPAVTAGRQAAAGLTGAAYNAAYNNAFNNTWTQQHNATAPVLAGRQAAAGLSGAAYNNAFNAAFNAAWTKQQAALKKATTKKK